MLDRRPFATLERVGYKMLVDILCPAVVATTPSLSPSTLRNALSGMEEESKGKATHALSTRYEEFARSGYRGGFCSLQLDMTTLANGEFIRLPTTLIHHDTRK